MISADTSAAREIALLRAVLDALPVGVCVETGAGDGSALVRNLAAMGLAASRHPDIETREQAIEVGGERFRLTILQDDTERQRVLRELFDRAYLDELTGLPNRSLLDRSVEQLLAGLGPTERFALAFIDIDNFKHINDFYSHAAGDALLVRIASRILSCLRPTDVLARLGGDEFVLVLTPLQDDADMTAEVERVGARLKDPFFIDGHEIFASASIGVSVFPEHGPTYEMLRRNADCAMYRAKHGQKGGVVVFDDTLSHAATAKMAQEQRFRLAIRDRRFTCAFQPKVDIRSREVLGVEVLLRWRDEQGAIQAPGGFVELATELGLIDEITMLVLAETVESLGEIDDAFGPDVTISINVAARQAVDPAFMSSFCEALGATGAPERFMVEITEEAFLQKDAFQRVILPMLRGIGAKVSIDDFGVGYSSLAALADITADEVKIDRSFITDIHKRPRSQSILKAIESLAASLGMAVIAEGVETYEELVWLQASTGIRAAQGYYFSRPVLLAQIAGSVADLGTRQAVPIGRPSAVARPALGLR